MFVIKVSSFLGAGEQLYFENEYILRQKALRSYLLAGFHIFSGSFVMTCSGLAGPVGVL